MFEEAVIEFIYRQGEKINKVTFKKDYFNNDFKSIVEFNMAQGCEKLRLLIIPSREIKIEKLSIVLQYNFNNCSKVFVNGYQSWTDSREFFIDERIKGISKLAAPLMRRYQFDKYGDYNFKKYSGKKGEFHGYTYSYIREDETYNLIGSLSERNGFTIIEHYTGRNKILINKECKGLIINKNYLAFDLLFSKGSESEVFDNYFEAMQLKKVHEKPGTGWTSWYNYYQNISEAAILENLYNFKDKQENIDIFQIDDGYETAVGDWLSVDDTKFPKGMKYIADSIKKCGYRAGIWLAPFVCETNSKLYKEKKDWILRDENGKLLSGGSNWSKFYVLDFYNFEVREYIKNVFSVILDCWGYDMVKLDFLYAVCIITRPYKTRGQIMTEAMEFLRECVGDKIILGCGVPLGPAFGLVDYCRIGCDVGLDWDDKFFMKLFHRERVSTLNAIRNTIGRRQLNNRAFLNDPDVFLLRKDNIFLSDIQKETLARVNNIFGSLLFTSDNIGSYSDKQFRLFNKTMELKSRSTERVTNYKNGFIEIIFKEGIKEFLLLINLSRKTISCSSTLIEADIELLPYESRIYAI